MDGGQVIAVRAQSRIQPVQAQSRIEALDSLRGVAALIVVVNHCCLMLPQFSDYAMHYRLPPIDWGDPVGFLLIHTPLRVLWLGRGPVMLFFVLSGFVLSLPWLSGRPPRYAAFAIRRVCRIYLPYLAAVAIAFLCATLLAPYRPGPQSQWFDQLNWTEPLTPTVAISHLLMLGTHNTFNNAIWSLVYEMRISLLFPLLILPLLRWRTLGALGLTVGFIVGAMGLSRLAGGEGVLREIGASLQYAVLFVLGAATAQHGPRLAVWINRVSPAWLTRVSPAFPWSLLLAGLLTLSVQWPIQPIFFQGLGGVLVILAALAPGPIAAFLRRGALRELGRISYSLYLIHLPVLLSAFYLLEALLPKIVILLCVPPVSLVAAWVFNRAIEDPAAELGRRLARGLRPLVPAVAAS